MAKMTIQKDSLKDILTQENFRQIESSFSKNFGLPIECTEIDSSEIPSLCSKNCLPAYCKLIRSSRVGISRCRQDRIRSLNIAIETGQPYISVCHAGLVLACIPIMDGQLPLGGMFFGKCIWEKPDDMFYEEIQKRLRGLRFDPGDIRNAVAALSTVSPRKIHDAAEFLYILLYQIAELDPQVVSWRREKSQQQSSISQVIHDTKLAGRQEPYPFDCERELIAKVKLGDRTGSKEILNNLLGAIMFHNPGDMNLLKARLVELLSVLSRSAAEGGVDIHLLLNKNLDYINRILHIDSQDELCAWISRALDDFTESVYQSQDARKMSQLRPALDFMETQYERPITLANIARAAHLSVSRLAHLFKEQMNITLLDYLTNVRINHAKRLLLTSDYNCTRICFDVGYNNQSYFTRIFKQITGMTPKQFRIANKRRQ